MIHVAIGFKLLCIAKKPIGVLIHLLFFHPCIYYVFTIFIHSATGHIQGYQVHDMSASGQCTLNISCIVRDRTVATGCVFMYDSNGDGQLDDEILVNLPSMGDSAEHHIIIDCSLNRLNFTLRAVAGTTLSATVPLDCPISSPSFNPVSSRGKQGFFVSVA